MCRPEAAGDFVMARPIVRRFCCIVGLAGLLGGSSSCAPVVIGTVAAGTLDAKLAQWTDGECSLEHIVVADGFCHTADAAKEPPPLYCFHSLGGVDCYAEADPYQVNPSGRVLSPPPLGSPGPNVAAAKPQANASDR
jgi:hypothetical protein